MINLPRICYLLSILKCIKLSLTNFQKINHKLQKICFINIHLTVKLSTFNKYCIFIIHDDNTVYQNKMLYNKIFFGTNFMGLLKISCIYRTNQKFNNKFRQFSMIFNNTSNCFVIFGQSDIALYTLIAVISKRCNFELFECFCS